MCVFIMNWCRHTLQQPLGRAGDVHSQLISVEQSGPQHPRPPAHSSHKDLQREGFFNFTVMCFSAINAKHHIPVDQ